MAWGAVASAVACIVGFRVANTLAASKS